MATYTRTYTFTNQKNTSAMRVISFDKFAVSGDTTRTIGQITGITFSHYHSKRGNASTVVELRARLVFANGTSVLSDGDAKAFQSQVKLFTNTFSVLPSVEQFSQILSLETVRQVNGVWTAASDGELYWRANASEPVVLTVTFDDVPPTHYAPKIDSFIVGRCDASGAMADDGTYISTTLKTSIGDAAGMGDNMSLRIYYAADAQPTAESSYIDITTKANTLLTGVEHSTTLIEGQWNAGNAWFFQVVFVTGAETARLSDSVGNAYAPIFISKDGKHVAIGGFAKKSGDTPSLEIYPDVTFYGSGGGDAIIVDMGAVAAQSLASGNVRDAQVTFAKTFSSAPRTIAMLTTTSSSGGLGRCSVSLVAGSSTATGCTLRIANYSGSALSIGASWIAIGN